MDRNTIIRPPRHSGLPVPPLGRTFWLGIRSLWLHRLRSFLTMLGIVFGVCSVIAMLAVGEGASHEAQEQIRKQGSQNILLRSVKPPEDEKSTAERTWMVEYGLTYEDIQRIRATIPTVEVVLPGRVIRKRVWNVGHHVDSDVVGTVPWYPAMHNHRVATGRFFTESEMDQRASVCVLSAEMVETLFPYEAAIGKAVRVDSDYYRVVGIMEPRSAREGPGKTEAQGSGGKGLANRLYIPLTAAKNRFGEILVKQSSGSREIERVELHEVTVRVNRIEDVMTTWRIVSTLLERNHDKRDYEIIVPLDLLRQAERTTRIFNIVLGTIAAVSLLVGGIGIMNIMLATVTERTREIGIRRALGAKRRDIIFQFLIETLILSGAGGVMGVVLGIGVPKLISAFTDMVTIVTLWSPVLAFSISALIGVLFGIYPAFRAANMDPVEALRHE